MLRSLTLACALVATTPFAATAQDQPAQSEFQADLEAFMSRPDIRRRMVSADNGDPYSMVWLSDKIEQELGKNFIEKKAILPFQVRYLMAAVEEGYGPAFKRMGDIVRYGRTPEGGPMDAMNFYEGGAKAGDADSAYEFYKMAADVKICSQCEYDDYTKKTYFKPVYSEEQQAQLDQAKNITKRVPIEREFRAEAAAVYYAEKQAMIERALQYLTQEKLADDYDMQSVAARIYLNGFTGASRDRLLFGHIENGDQTFLVRPQPEKTKEILERFAATGTQRALAMLSDLYLVGKTDVFPQNRDLFIKYAQQSADLGSSVSAYKLGHTMASGNPFGTDFPVAVKYLTQAHEAGMAKATLDLAFMALEGRGVPEDQDLAIERFKLASDRGSSKAAEFLSDWYGNGRGGERSGMLGLSYKAKAAENRAKEEAADELMRKLDL